MLATTRKCKTSGSRSEVAASTRATRREMILPAWQRLEMRSAERRPPSLSEGEASLWAVVTWFGYAPQSRVAVVGLAALLWKVCGIRAALIEVSTGAIWPLGTGLKAIVKRPRPLTAWLTLEPSSASAPSMPSTHAADYTTIFGYAAVKLWRAGGSPRLVAGLLAALILAVGPARIREGDHRPDDVVVGYALGAALLASLFAIDRRFAAHQIAGLPSKSQRAQMERPESRAAAPHVDGGA